MQSCCGMGGRSGERHQLTSAGVHGDNLSSSAQPSPGARDISVSNSSRARRSFESPREFRKVTINGAVEKLTPRSMNVQSWAPSSHADKALLNAVDGQDVDGHADEHELEWLPLEEDLYGLAIVSLFRDFHRLEEGIGCWQSFVRVSRLAISILLVVINSILQAYLLVIIKLYITAPAVLRARDVYGAFETSMYDDTVQTKNGNSRGVLGHFHPDFFDSLSEDRKEVACAIPLSEPHFLLTFVVLWSLTCLDEAKGAVQSYWACCLRVPLVSSMRQGVHEIPGAQGPERAMRRVVGITCSLRAVLLLLVAIPRLAVSLALLWLGCRWLVATTSFSDLFLNAVALKFVLTFKDTFYVQLIPERNKRDVANTLFPPFAARERPTLSAYAAALIVLPIAVAWSYYYVFHLQAVLPRYRWDVHDVCKKWLAQHLAA